MWTTEVQPPPHVVAERIRHAIGGDLRVRCGAWTPTGPCRQVPLFRGKRCLRHCGVAAAVDYRERQRVAFIVGQLPEVDWRRAEIRRAKNRVRNRRRGKGDNWLLPGIVMAFSPKLEAAFQDTLRPLLVRHRRHWADVPDGHRDLLRFAWRRFQLDRPRGEAWEAKATAVLMDLDRRCEDRCGLPLPVLEHDDGSGEHVQHVTRRPTAYSKRSRLGGQEVRAALAAPARVAAAHAAGPGVAERGQRKHRSKWTAEDAAATARPPARRGHAAAAKTVEATATPSRPRGVAARSTPAEAAAAAATQGGAMGAAREANRQRLYRECWSALQSAELPGFRLEAALDALERRDAGDATAWTDYLLGLGRGGLAETAAKAAARPGKPTRQERVLAARWAPTIDLGADLNS